MMDKSVSFTKSDTHYPTGENGEPVEPFGDWDRNTAYRTTVWLYLSRMQAVGLYQP